MALIDKASLLMVPSTYEAGTLYNVIPSGNRAPDSTDQNSGYDQTRADFDFDRGSNAAATRVNASGLIEKYRENLVTHSNNFSDSDWTKVNCTPTSGFEGYDGTNNAWKLTASTAGTSQIKQTHGTSGMITHSIYAKAGTIDVLKFWVGLAAEFNLTTGATSYSQSKMTDVGNGWWRCEVYLAYTIINPFFSATTAGDYIYIQNAQAESSLVATDYLESTSVTGKAGVLVDLPRINYDANGENGALLLEPSRQNLITQSEYFGDSSWNNSNEVTRSISSIVSPEGFLNAYDIIPTTANTNHTLRAPNLSGFTSGAVVNVSFFAKEKGYKFISVVGGFGSSNTPAVVFNLEAGTIESGTGTIEDYGNGWYRCISPITLNATALYCVGTILNDSQSGSFSGDATKGISVFGYQIEEASYPTSYIPTMGTSQTRAADSCSVTGVSDVIGQTEGTLYWEVDFGVNDSAEYPALFLYDGTSNNRILIQRRGNNQLLQYQINAGGSNQVDEFSTTAVGSGKVKIAIAYKANDFVLYLNGSQEASDTSGSTFSGALSQIAFENTRHDKTYQTALFKERLSNAELATLTTL